MANSPYKLKGQRISFNSASAQTLITAVPGQRIAVYRLRLSVSAPTNITIQDTLGNVFEVFQLGANGAVVLDPTEHLQYDTPIGSGLQIVSSSAVQVEGRISYVQEA